MSDKRKLLSRSYNQAGKDFLAYRLTRVLTQIETQDDIALHNDVMNELDVMIGDNTNEVFKGISELILTYSTKGLT